MQYAMQDSLFRLNPIAAFSIPSGHGVFRRQRVETTCMSFLLRLSPLLVQ